MKKQAAKQVKPEDRMPTRRMQDNRKLCYQHADYLCGVVGDRIYTTRKPKTDAEKVLAIIQGDVDFKSRPTDATAWLQTPVGMLIRTYNKVSMGYSEWQRLKNMINLRHRAITSAMLNDTDEVATKLVKDFLALTPDDIIAD